MQKMDTKIKNFTDLLAWQEGHKLVLLLYNITSKFPQREIYSLTDQMRRCATSVTSNIAEGFARQGKKEKIQFYYIALGSITELENQLLIAKDLSYIQINEFQKIMEVLAGTQKLISGLIKYLKNT